MKHIFAAVLSMLCAFVSAAPQLPASLKTEPDGTFTFNGIAFEITVSNARWQAFANKDWQERDGKSGKAGVDLRGFVLPEAGSGRGEITETVTPLENGSIAFRSTLNMQEPCQLNRVSGSFTLPVGKCAVSVDGKEIAIPEKQNGSPRLYLGHPKTVRLRGIGAEELVVKPQTCDYVMIQDNRKYGSNSIAVFFVFRTGKTGFSKSELILNLSVEPVASHPVALEPFINRAFSGRAGGTLPVWTLQGEDASLSMFRETEVNPLGICFAVSPRGAAAVGGKERGGVPASMTIPVSMKRPVRALNLFHTSAWTPPDEFGEVRIQFSDGSGKTFPVSGLRDCGNWVGPRPLSNAAIAWTGMRSDSMLGVYCSTFPFPAGKNPVSVTFHTNSSQVIWLILGMTFTEGEIFFPAQESSVKIVAGKEWFPLEFRNSTRPGSPLDFSGLLDAPAGKYGAAVPAPDGTLRFRNAPEKRLRLFGTNFCNTMNFPAHEVADSVVRQIARNGYNAVRFHHHDDGLVDSASADSVTLNKENLDRLDYLFAAFKKQGIYVVTDLYASRRFRSGDNLPYRNAKGAFQSDPRARENWKAFVRAWLTHRNPYTGLTWAEDPALVMVNLINEDDPLWDWNTEPAVRDRHIQLFAEWKKKNGCSSAKADTGDRDFIRFLFELKRGELAELTAFVKEELKLQANVTSINWHQKKIFTLLREKFDVTDDHYYHDHRVDVRIKGRTVNGHHQLAGIATGLDLPAVLTTSRIPGKPFFVTEYNHCRPNRFRAETGPVMGAYPALQDWTGIFRFCYSHNVLLYMKNRNAFSCFESVADPVMQLSDRITAAMFLRGDVRPAEEGYSFAVSENILTTGEPLEFPEPFTKLGLLVRTGSHRKGMSLPEGMREFSEANLSGAVSALWRESLAGRRAVSSTGEITADFVGRQMTVCTPRSESFTGTGDAVTGGILSVRRMDTFGTVAALSLDGDGLRESRKILLLHLTDTANSGDTFFDPDCRIVDDYGSLPLLVRRGSAEVELALDGPVKVTALSADGDELGAVRVENNRFRVATDLFKGGVMAYCITR